MFEYQKVHKFVSFDNLFEWITFSRELRNWKEARFYAYSVPWYKQFELYPSATDLAEWMCFTTTRKKSIRLHQNRLFRVKYLHYSALNFVMIEIKCKWICHIKINIALCEILFSLGNAIGILIATELWINEHLC